jgi:hypothetical protein
MYNALLALKIIVLIALVANDRTSFAVLLGLFWACLYVPKMVRDVRSRRQIPTFPDDSD